MTAETKLTIAQAVDRLAWEVGALPEDEFPDVWTALGYVTRSVLVKKKSIPNPTPEATVVWL